MPSSKTATRASIYSLHPGFKHEAASLANLQKNTGKSMEEWIQIAKSSGLPTEKEQAEWLKTKHKLGTNICGWIAERAAGKRGAEDYNPEALVNAMYSAKKADLFPLYEKLLELGLSLGDDVKACPCKTMVPLYRAHVFAEIKPTTNTRIDLGFALKDTKPKGRLVETGGFAKGDRITHRMAISTPADIDNEVLRWLKAAYDLDGKTK